MEPINTDEYRKICEDARTQSNIGMSATIAEILEGTEMVDYLENKTAADLTREIYDILHSMPVLTVERIESYCSKLVGYRYVDRVCDFRPGKQIRWLNKETGRMSGGIMLSTRITTTNLVAVMCLLFGKRTVFCVVYNKHHCFQKLTDDEQMILLANEYLGGEDADEDDEDDEDGTFSG